MRGSRSRVLGAFVSHPFYIPQRIILYLCIVIRGFYPALLCRAGVSKSCIYWPYCVFLPTTGVQVEGGTESNGRNEEQPPSWLLLCLPRTAVPAVASSFLTSLTPRPPALAGVVTVIGRTIKCERRASAFCVASLILGGGNSARVSALVRGGLLLYSLRGLCIQPCDLNRTFLSDSFLFSSSTFTRHARSFAL